MEKLIDDKKIELYSLSIELGNSGHFTNCYIVKDKKTKNTMIIDPSYDEKYIIECLNNVDGNLKIIFLTHCHGDHISALEGLFNNYKNNVKILIHENDRDGIFNEYKNCKYILGVPNFSTINISNINTVKDKDIINIGDTEFKVIHTPGHTNGSSILYDKNSNILITGDTIFSDCYGRTDLKSGSIVDMKNSIYKVFNTFRDDTVIYPGHGKSAILKETKEKLKSLIALK